MFVAPPCFKSYDEKHTTTMGKLRKCDSSEIMTHFEKPQLLRNITSEGYMRSTFYYVFQRV